MKIRNSDRIETFLKAFSDLWHKYPDLRFGQLFHIIKDVTDDGFYIEDKDMFIKILERLNNEQLEELINKYCGGIEGFKDKFYWD